MVTDDPRIGQWLHNYQIVACIGSGGMGRVYRAWHALAQRNVAIKFLRATLTGDPSGNERFAREAQAIAQLRHPHIVQLYDFDISADGYYYIVMEFIAGESLGTRLAKLGKQKTRLPQAQVQRIVDQVLDALAHVHAREIIHRDIKPDNILLDANDNAFLTDFGIARLPTQPGLTGLGDTVGTAAYIAPEQLQPQSAIDHRADLYSLGIVLYELLTGRLPFIGENNTALCYQHVHEAAPPPRQFAPDIPPAVEAVMLKALVKLPDSRYQSATELREALALAWKARDLPPESSATAHIPTPLPTDYGRYLAAQPTNTTGLSPDPNQGRIFLCYQRYAIPDQELALTLNATLTAQGYQVFIDQSMRIGTAWLDEIDRQLRASDLLVVLLSAAAAHSEMVQAEIQQAHEYARQQGHPHILPVRVTYTDMLPFALAAFLSPVQYTVWESPADTPRVAAEILAVLAGQWPGGAPAALPATAATAPAEEMAGALSHPQSEMDVTMLPEPGGAVELSDPYYIERADDARLKREIAKSGATITIRAPRQTGKSSLLARGLDYAQQRGIRYLCLNLQREDEQHLQTLEGFLRRVADFVTYKLHLAGPSEAVWARPLSPQNKLTFFMEDSVLPEIAAPPLILAFEEADRLLETTWYTEFFALLRSWHDERVLNPLWKRLNLVLVIATEPYLLIADAHQSPFNVGLRLKLEDFTPEQVAELNQRHGTPVGPTDFPHLMALLDGHPYLTRKALYELILADYTWPEFHAAAPRDDGPFGDHLRRYTLLLHRDTALCDALREVIHGDSCSDNPAFFRLLRSGLVKGTAEACTCRCDLYRQYFADKV